jgi:hypothetical protein
LTSPYLAGSCRDKHRDSGLACVPVSDAGERIAVLGYLARAAEACRTAASEAPARSSFARHVVPALAALEALSGKVVLEPADLRFARNVCSDAAAAVRTRPPDDGVTALAQTLDDVVDACDVLLWTPVEHGPRWHRFLFRDADVEVRRVDGLWAARAGEMNVTDRFLDAALERLLPLPGHRVAELTVQILDWIEFRARSRD